MNSADTAALARLLRGARLAHLGTLRQGAPLVSMTLFLAAPGFDAFHVHVSRLAWHTQDMAADPRVALSIAETDDGREDPFTLALSGGLAGMLLFQMIVNIGMVLGVMPITGIPLPFVTHGGASLISAALGLGILETLAMRRSRST